jgi:3-methylcrotonyl-CoA carboxylase alpha subunit
VARQSEAEAVHPGYGFLAENPEFARAVQSAGLVWVGPPPDVISLLGDKVASKSLAVSLGIPVIPGYDGQDQSLDRFREEADRIGYPVMIKATSGGGGRGMREVRTADDLEPALESARREAKSSFGDDAVFLEKLLVTPRHLEVQVLADEHGNAVHLGERDCSIQRRHQKIIEESPSPALTSDLRAAMGGDALRLVRESQYVGAGTVEFLFSGDDYYFLEMNARIQVEHPVTEEVTGLDLIRLQIDVTQGHPIPLAQLDVRLDGHAVEARIYAENAETGFLPSTGLLTVFQPPEGIGVRNDVGVSVGSEVTSHYDPMLAKLIVHGGTRHDTFARLNQALTHYRVSGISTNLTFLQWVVSQETVLAARADVGFVDRAWQGDFAGELPPEVLIAVAGHQIEANVDVSSRKAPYAHHYSPWQFTAAWRQIGLPRSFTYLAGGVEHHVDAFRGADGTWAISTDKAETVQVRFKAHEDGRVTVAFDSRTVSAFVEPLTDGFQVNWSGKSFHLQRPTSEALAHTSNKGANGSNDLSTPMPGTVIKVVVIEGQHVSMHDPLMVLEAMKMEHVISAGREGVIQKIFFREGDLVPAGSVVLSLEAT